MILHRDAASLGFLAANHGEVVDARKSRLTDLGAEHVGLLVDGNADRVLLQAIAQRMGIADLGVTDRQDAHLLRREPQRELAFEVFDQDAEEALERTEDRTMQHDAVALLPVLVDVGGIETVLAR